MICLSLSISVADRPKTPASLICLQEPKVENFCSMVYAAMCDKSFILLTISFTMLYSVFLALSVILDPFFESLGVDHSQVSIIGGVFVVAGVLSSLFFGVLLDKYRKYLVITRILCFGSLLVLAGCFGTFR